MGIVHDLGEGPVCLDTCVFIYFIEEDERYIEIVASIFEAIDGGRLSAVTSGITLLETLVIPLQAKDSRLANLYAKLLTESKGLTLLNLDRDLLRQGAYIRANFRVKTPDALQIAAAQLENCKVFVTNDRDLPKIPDLQILHLSAYVQ